MANKNEKNELESLIFSKFCAIFRYQVIKDIQMNDLFYYLPVVSALLVPGVVVLIAGSVFVLHKRTPRHRRRGY